MKALENADTLSALGDFGDKDKLNKLVEKVSDSKNRQEDDVRELAKLVKEYGANAKTYYNNLEDVGGADEESKKKKAKMASEVKLVLGVEDHRSTLADQIKNIDGRGAWHFQGNEIGKQFEDAFNVNFDPDINRGVNKKPNQDEEVKQMQDKVNDLRKEANGLIDEAKAEKLEEIVQLQQRLKKRKAVVTAEYERKKQLHDPV